MTAIIITGPQGSGKTLAAEALAKHFKKVRIIDEWKPGDPMPANALCLTNVPVCSAPNVWRIEDALQDMQLKTATALTGWRSINDAAPKDGTKVDLWLHIRATPRSFGMSDSFRVTDCWWNAGSWKHRNEKGQVEDLIASYVTHWMRCPAPPNSNKGG